MRLAAERPAERYDRIVWWGGLTSLALGFALALALAIWLAFSAPGVAWALPVAIVAIGVAMVTLPRSPYTPVALYLGLFTTVSGHSVGLQPHEILFAFVHTGYIAWWFWTRGMVRRERILRDVGDMTLMAFVVYAVGSLGLTVLFGGNVTDGVAEALTMSLFAAYFPVREAFERGGEDERRRVRSRSDGGRVPVRSRGRAPRGLNHVSGPLQRGARVADRSRPCADE